MADKRAAFCILEDAASKAGLPLHMVVEGDDIAAKNALAALVAKDGDDHFSYLKVNGAGALYVDTELSNTAELYDSGTHEGDNEAYQPLATITLTVDKNYSNLHLWASSFRDTMFQLIHNNNGTPATLIDGIRAGAGCFSFAGIMKQLNFTAGAEGTQQLILKGKNLNAESTMDGAIGIDESL